VSWKCKILGHLWMGLATQNYKRAEYDDSVDIFVITCRRRTCGHSAILKVWGKSPETKTIDFFEKTKSWKKEDGPIHSWAKILVN
jgi:hypothetical protein